MAQVLRRIWPPNSSGLTRSDRGGCRYQAYVPDPLAGRTFRLEGGVAADVADAEAAITRLNASARALADTEALARLLLRAESVASSRIEGLEVGPRRLLRAELAKELGDEPRDVTAEEVLGNVEAMAWSVGALASEPSIAVAGLLEAHRRLLAGTRLDAHAGRIRDVQNWIGGSSYNPCSAVFVPPPPERCEALLRDLCAFASDDSLSPVAAAAVAHAQFETIHPFVDGNGRIGRALIHVILRRRGLASAVSPAISLILATLSRSYIDGLRATRYHGREDSRAAHAGINGWIAFFAGACRRAVDDASAFEDRIANVKEHWRAKLDHVRARSAIALLMDALPGDPILTATGAAALIGRSFQATNEAIARLEAAGILKQLNVGRRNRAFEAKAVIDAFIDLERRLASAEGDTLVSPPKRRTPRR